MCLASFCQTYRKWSIMEAIYRRYHVIAIAILELSQFCRCPSTACQEHGLSGPRKITLDHDWSSRERCCRRSSAHVLWRAAGGALQTIIWRRPAWVPERFAFVRNMLFKEIRRLLGRGEISEDIGPMLLSWVLRKWWHVSTCLACGGLEGGHNQPYPPLLTEEGRAQTSRYQEALILLSHNEVHWSSVGVGEAAHS